MADIILSIKPRHSQDILDLRKTSELRRRVPARPVTRVVIYETAPTQAIVGEFTVPTVLDAPPAELWDRVGDRACVTREEFDKYFGPRRGKPCSVAYALEVGKVTRYRQPINPRSVDPFWSPPQSFAYLSLAIRNAIEARDQTEWLTLDEVVARIDSLSPELAAAVAACAVPVGPEYMRARIVDGVRVTLYSPAAVALMRG